MPKIVILGGGFAGVAVARRLERLLRPDEAEIVMISRENYTIFTPMLPEVASGGIETRHIVTPVRAELKRTQFVLADVTAIDPAAKRAYYTHTLLGTHESIDYDQLVVGVGAITSTFGLPGIAEHTLPLKRIEDAERLRNHVIATLERADVTADPAERKRLLTYAFVGGGYTGVEAAGETVDFVRSIHRFYRSIERRDISIVLIEGGKRLLPTLPEEMSDYTARNLSSRGVDLVIGTNVASADADGIVLADGRRIESRTLVWTAGVRPAKLVEGLDLERARNGALVTRPDMSVPGCEGMWAIGDCASIPMEGGGTYPMTAQHAIREGPVLAENIVAAMAGRPTKPFHFKALGTMASLGARRGVAGLGGSFTLKGFPAWVLWRTYYLARLPGIDRRLRVTMDWTLGLFFPRDIAELRMASRPASRAANDGATPRDPLVPVGIRDDEP